MEYVDGGLSLTRTSYGYSGYFNKSECSDLSNVMWMGTGAVAITGAILAFYSCGLGVLVAGIIGGLMAIGAGYLGIAANHNGMNFKIVGTTFVPGTIRW